MYKDVSVLLRLFALVTLSLSVLGTESFPADKEFSAKMKRVISEKELKQRIAKFPRLKLTDLPTPLEEAQALSAKLGGPRILIKRDDQTGIAFGGNKGRKLEFIMADAVKKKADVIVTWAGVQSNWCRQLAAAARKLGIKPILVLSKRPGLPADYDGNLLLDYILDAEIRLVEAAPGKSATEEVMAVVDRVVREEKEKGHKPYLVSVGGSAVGGSMTEPLGAISYTNAFLEIVEQAKKQKLEIDAIVLATGSGSTQAGLVVGAKALGGKTKVIGISVSSSRDSMVKLVSEIAATEINSLGLKMSIDPAEIIVFDDYVGEGYGLLNKETVEAIRLTAETEGVMLDPVYTGKAMAGLLDLTKKGYFKKGETIVFLHTGGTPALFPYREKLMEFLKELRPSIE